MSRANPKRRERRGSGAAASAIGPERRAMIAKVHVAKKQLGLDDDAYRDVVGRITGGDSVKDCSLSQLNMLLREFERLGFEPTNTGPRKPWVGLVKRLWREIVPHLDGKAGDAELAAFVRRQTRSEKNPEGIARPEWLDPAEARKVIEGLKGWRDRLPAKQGGDGNVCD